MLTIVNWTLTSSIVEDYCYWIIVEATHKLDTGGTQDSTLKNEKELWSAPDEDGKQHLREGKLVVKMNAEIERATQKGTLTDWD